MKKLLKKNESIHTSTQAEADGICSLMKSKGIYTSSDWWEMHTVNTVYNWDGSFSSLQYAKGENYKIYPASQFLNQ